MDQDLNQTHDRALPDHSVFDGHPTSTATVLGRGRVGDDLVLLDKAGEHKTVYIQDNLDI